MFYENMYVQLKCAHFIYLMPGAQFLCFIFRLPGNTRTKIGFITFDSTIHFYSLQEGLSQPQMLIISDIEGKKK